MRLNRKWILVIALVVSMATAISGTLAYLTSTDTATNTFTVGNVSIDLEEPSWDPSKTPTLLPGVEIAKDPQIKNTGSTEAWVWMEITVPTDLMPYIDWNTTAWTRSETTSGNNTVVTLKRATLLPAGETTATAFTKVALPASLERMPESLVTSGTVEIVVNAYAIQSDAATTIDAAINAYGTNGEGGEGNEPAGNVTVSNETELTEALAANNNVTFGADITGESFSSAKNITLTNGNIYTENASHNYGYIVEAGGSTTFDNVNITTKQGGIGIVGTAIFKSGSVTNNSTSTSGRHVFYVEGGSLTIEDGVFTFSPSNLTRKGSYIYSNNSTVVVNGGTFNKPSSRDGHDPFVTANGGTITVYGGKFAFDPSAFVADGYQAVESDGWWTVSAIQ